MIKTLQNTLKQDKEGFAVPKSVQDAIPIRRVWPDGIFQFGSKFSKTIRFSDINYAIASKEDKTSMFLGYSELLNALDTGSTTKITINNKRLNRQNFEQEILIPRRNDYLDGYRSEYNAMLTDKVTDSSNSVVQERYVTLSVHRKNVEEARAVFDRVTADVTTRMSQIDAHSEELDAVDRLRVLHDFYRTGEETEYNFNLKDAVRKGHSFKDAICPDSLEFRKDHFIMGNKYGRVLFLKEFASYIKDSMINELTALNRTMMLSIDVIPVPTDEAVREMQSRLLGVETNVTNWQRRQNSNNNFSAVVPYDLEQQRKETREMLDDLTTRDQRMMFAVVTLVHLADSKEELDSDTETLQSTARKHLCQLATLNWQQADGLVTALPLGLRRIDALRTLTTEALAVLMPFKAQEIRDQGGVYYGQNVISKNLIIANRKELLNGNGFILGVSGSGKSFTAKEEMAAIAAAQELIAAIAAGGWVVILVVLVICLAAMLIASPFGIFFSGENAGRTMPEAVAQLNGEFTARIEQIQEDAPHDTLDLDNNGTAAMLSNWNNVLAVYAVRTAMDESSPESVAVVTDENLSLLREIFWEMNQIIAITEFREHTETVTNEAGEEEEVTTTEKILHISVENKDCWQMADEYSFTDDQREMLTELLKPEYRDMFLALTGSNQDITLSPQEVQQILERLPDGLSKERKQVVMTAYQLLGKVNYFWSGKSLVLGWDSRWGTPKEVWAAGSPSTGTVRPYGLDCSGFVDWVFYNVSGGSYVIGHGGGASAQHSYCSNVSWSEAVPGDLAFYPGDSHVGIVCGFDTNGNVQIIHCASGSLNNVVVTGKSGFTTVGRPNYYGE